MSTAILETGNNGHLGRTYYNVGALGWVIFGVTAAFFGSLSENPLLTATSIMILPIFAVLLWRRGEPPILFFAISFQWLQGTMKTFDADIRGLTLIEYFQDWSIERAAWLTIVGLLVLAIGMRVSLIGMNKKAPMRVANEVENLSVKKIWYAYLAFFLVALIGKNYLYISPRFAQILLALLNLKWVFFFLLATIVLARKENRVYLFIATVLEIVVGFSGFFSDYKQVFFVLILVYLTLGAGLNRRTIARTAFVILLVGYMSIVWSSVKLEYRDYISGGTGAQIIDVSLTDRLEKLLYLYSDVDLTDIRQGFQTLAKRIAYIDYFGYVLNRVPREAPYADGELWGQAITHVLFPRLFFPNKAALVSDTEITEKYTGLQLISQGGRQTDIPLGYMAETYVDYGPFYMFFPIFIVGAVWGLMYRYFISRKKEIVFSYGLAVAVLLGASQLEISTIKMVGGMLMGFGVLAFSQRIILPGVHRLLLEKKRLIT